MGGAVRREHVVGTRRGPNVGQAAARMPVDRRLVVMIAEVDAGFAQSQRIDLVRQRQAIIVVRQAFTVDPDAGEMVVVVEQVD